MSSVKPSNTMAKEMFRGKTGLFFKVYFIIITIILVFQLLHSGKTTFHGQDLSGTGDNVYEINDDKSIELITTVGDDDLCGVYIDGYLNELNLIFNEEKLILSVLDTETDEVLSESVFLLRDQPPAIDQTGTYFPIDASIPQGKEICLKFHSEGLSKRGVFYEVSDEALVDNKTIAGGETLDQTLCASFYYRDKKIDILTPILFFLFEAAVGIVLFIISRTFKMSVWKSNRSKESGLIHIGKRKPVNRRSLLIFVLACGLFMGIGMEFAYNIAVRPISTRYDGDVLYVDDYNIKTRVAMTEDTVVEQVFRSDKKNLCGIGLEIQNNSDKEDDEDEKAFYTSDKEKERLKDVAASVKNVKGYLTIELYDNDTDELLAENQYEVGYLKTLNSYLIPDLKSHALRIRKANFVYFAFGKIIENSENGEFRVRITAQDTGENGIRLSSSAKTNGTYVLNGETKKASLCFTTVYNYNNGIANWYFILVFLMIISLIAIGVLIRCFTIREETVFLLVALSMGLLFSLVVPPYCVPDERTHVDTIYKMSNELLGIEGSPAPGRIYRRKCDIDASISNTMSLASYMYRDMYNDLFDSAGEDTELTVTYARNSLENVTVLNYLPGVIGFTAARLLNRNLLTAVMMARWGILLTVILLMYAAVRKTPLGKGAFAIAGLMPKTINQIVSCSYDGILIGAVFVFLAYTLYIMYEDDITAADLMIVLFSAWFIACNKAGVYMPLTLLLLAVPYCKKNKKRMWAKLSLGMIISSFAVILIKFIPRFVDMFSRTSGMAQRSEGGQKLYTVSDFIVNPGKLIRILENTFILKGQSLFGEMIGGSMGQRSMQAGWIIIMACFFLLILSVIASKNDNLVFTVPQRILIVVITLMGIGLLDMSMLIGWTENTSDVVQGLQGRYFLPYLILPILAVKNRKIIRTGEADNRQLIWVAGVLLFAAFICLMSAVFYCQPIKL